MILHFLHAYPLPLMALGLFALALAHPGSPLRH